MVRLPPMRSNPFIAASGPSIRFSLLDGIYVTVEEVLLGMWAVTGPRVRRGRFRPAGSHGRRALDQYAFATGAWAARGSTPMGLEHRIPLRDVNSDLMLRAWEAFSLLLVTARLHFTLLTGRLTTKTDADPYGLMTFPQCWAPILDQALAVRRDGANSPAALRPGDVAAFTAMVATDMQELALDARG